tara:strand:- start:4246 stop:5163 length:918 start_codon:yes stop_codon:yes gene_type:complete
MKLQVFEYEGSKITFDFGDDHQMINATEMAKPFGKLVGHFLMLKQTKEYIEIIAEEQQTHGITRYRDSTEVLSSYYSQLSLAQKQRIIRIVRGGNEQQGTWMCKDLAMEFARWLNPRFALWTNRRVRELLQTGVTTIKPTFATMSESEKLRAHADALDVAVAEKEGRLLAEAKSIASEEAKIKAEAEVVQYAETHEKIRPYVHYAKVMLESKQSIPVGIVAKALAVNGMGRNNLYRYLKSKKVLDNENIPYQPYINNGYFEVTVNSHGHSYGPFTKTKVFQKGIVHIIKLLVKDGYTPKNLEKSK